MNAPSPLAAAVLITWRRNAEYAVRLAGDLTPDQWVAQPVPGSAMNHPAWVFTHLNLYGDIAVNLARGEPFDDPAEHPHGQKSRPLIDLSEYPAAGAMIESWKSIHQRGAAALAAVGPEFAASPNPLPRWRALHPTVGDMLVTLMVKHESAHLGQLSAWRRAMHLPSVPM